jgi:hypothetical protein
LVSEVGSIVALSDQIYDQFAPARKKKSYQELHRFDVPEAGSQVSQAGSWDAEAKKDSR